MRHVRSIAVVVPSGAFLSSLGALPDAVAVAKAYVRQQYGAIDPLPASDHFELADVTLLGLDSDRPVSAGGTLIPVSGRAIGDATFDIVVIADHAGEAAPCNPPPRFITWLLANRAVGALITASGKSVELLAGSGLLDGKRATAPWWLLDSLRDRHPKILFSTSEAIVEDDDLLSSIGIATDQILAMRLIEHVTSRNFTLWLKRRLAFCGELNEMGGTEIADPLLLQAQQWLYERFSTAVRIEELAIALGVTRRTLLRHFTAGAGMTPTAYLEMLRIEAAKRMLERTSFRVDRIAGLVGYADTAFFRRIFRRSTGQPPLAWRRQQNATGARPGRALAVSSMQTELEDQ